MNTIADLRKIAEGLEPRRVLIPGGDRKEDVELAQSLRDAGLVPHSILVGDAGRIRQMAESAGLTVADSDIVHSPSQDQTARLTAEMVEQGRADVILKGNISSPLLNRTLLRLKTRHTISQVTVFETPYIAADRPILFTDSAVTTVCDLERLSDLVRNAAEVARLAMDIRRPRVALLSANEKVIESLPSTRLAAELTKARWENMVVYGPLSFDLAVDPKAVSLKGIPVTADDPMAEVAGRADVLVCPGLDSANLLYKLVMSLAHHGQASMASITVGLKVPYVVVSRADPLANKLNSVALCCVYDERLKNPAAKANSAAPETR